MHYLYTYLVRDNTSKGEAAGTRPPHVRLWTSLRMGCALSTPRQPATTAPVVLAPFLYLGVVAPVDLGSCSGQEGEGTTGFCAAISDLPNHNWPRTAPAQQQQHRLYFPSWHSSARSFVTSSYNLAGSGIRAINLTLGVFN